MAEVVWSEPAAADLEEIVGYISLDNPDAAERLVHRILRHTKQLEKHPKSDPEVTDFPGSGYRLLIEPPCRIFYRIEGRTVHVLRVLRTERLIRPSFFEDTE